MKWGAACLGVVVVAGVVAFGVAEHSGGKPRTPVAEQPARKVRFAAASWVNTEIGHDTTIACEPAMCTALADRGVPEHAVRRVRTGATLPGGADVVVVTPRLRRELGRRLDSRLAPSLLGAFGAGSHRIEVRQRAPAGRSQAAAWSRTGLAVLGSRNLWTTRAAAQQLAGGEVDPRVMHALRRLAATHSIGITRFYDRGPRSGSDAPLRGVDIARLGGANVGRANPALPPVLRSLRTQAAIYRPAATRVARSHSGDTVLRVWYRAPTPRALLHAGRHGRAHAGAPSSYGLRHPSG